MEIQDDRWGCWISLKELARLRLIDSLAKELVVIAMEDRWADFIDGPKKMMGVLDRIVDAEVVK